MASLLILAAGCSHRQSADEELDDSLKRMGVSRVAVYPLAGRVTIDGQPPKSGNRRQKILVVLNESTKPNGPPLERRFVECNAQGEFAFRTYTERDGIAPGKFAVTFVQLVDRGKRGYLGPDGFKNLYNDPDKSEFQITHAEDGRTDYLFDLKIEGRQAVNPGKTGFQILAESPKAR